MLESKDFEKRKATIPEELRKIADELEHNGKAVEAFHIMVVFRDGQAARIKRYNNETNLLNLMGLLEVSKTEIAMDIIENGEARKYGG